MTNDEHLAVQVGDIVLSGSSYFWVHRIHEPTVPAAGGLVLEGCRWVTDQGTWGEVQSWHYMPDMAPYPLRILDDDSRKGFGFPPWDNRSTPVETRTFCDTEVPIPANARRPCSRCGQPMRLLDDLHLDEGDGTGMIGLSCDQCRIESCHSWAIPDEDYEAVFGHRFGDDPDDEDGNGGGPPPVPCGPIPPSPAGSGTSYQQGVNDLVRAADEVAEYRGDLAAFADTLAGKGWGTEVTGPVQDMDGQLVALEGDYRDLATRMRHQGDQGQAAYDQAPYVPGPEAVLT